MILDQKSVLNELQDFILYPNPVRPEDKLSMEINSLSELNADIYFYSAMGQLVKHEIAKLGKGNTLVSFDKLNLEKGVYIIKIPSIMKDQFFSLIVE